MVIKKIFWFILKTIFFTFLTFVVLLILSDGEIPDESIFIIVPSVLLLVFLFSGKKKQKQETVQSSEDENNIEPIDKNIIPDFNKDNRKVVKDLVLETNKKITQALRYVPSMTLRKNLQLLYSQVSSIDYNYSQRKLSFDQVMVELNSIQQDTETLSKELETFNTNIADEVDLTFIEETNYFKLFGLNQDATYQEIKLAYMDKVKQYHPDKVAEGSQQEKMKAQKICQKINKAYQVLTNQLKMSPVLKK